ncbi:hypothetical protein Ancab_000763 [Ancistrocladus abbreviatus]
MSNVLRQKDLYGDRWEQTIAVHNDLSNHYAKQGRISDIKQNNEHSTTRWSPLKDRCLIDLMLKQLHDGSRVSDTLDNQAWIDMILVLNENFGSVHNEGSI